ncbi:MAG: cob(I)yrinic acid a,c-diamide adenosyltransferase [Lachnospiraceae bacterium]|nr:cob(I)yrinic acid a,c-diamide adenosyltransferase [Lachnospiraceae bacterium]
MEAGKIQVYYGEGQGKSSAALGNAVRAGSRGKTAYIIHFMKYDENVDFMKGLEPNVKIFRFEKSERGFDDLTDEEKSDEKQNIANGLNFAKKALVTEECDVLVLDEVLGLIDEGIITNGDLLNILNEKSLFSTVILTGRSLPDEIRKAADEVLNIMPE